MITTNDGGPGCVVELAGIYTNIEPKFRPGRVGGDVCCAHVVDVK